MRTLLLTSPAMKGADVAAVQGRIGLPRDGVFGPATAAAVKAWRWRTGFPRALPGIGPWGQRVMLGQIPLPQDYHNRAAARAKAAAAAVTAPERAAAVMEHWASLGLKENPAGSNRVPELATVAKALGLSAWYQAMGWPWCAFSAMLAAKASGGQTAAAGFAGQFNVLYVPAILAAAQAGRFGMSVVPASSVRRGDLVIFNWDGGPVDHVGRVTAPPSGGTVRTVEGNTSSSIAGSQNNGGGMYLRDRALSLVSAFVRDT